jgi:hypothetical protein
VTKAINFVLATIMPLLLGCPSNASAFDLFGGKKTDTMPPGFTSEALIADFNVDIGVRPSANRDAMTINDLVGAIQLTGGKVQWENIEGKKREVMGQQPVPTAIMYWTDCGSKDMVLRQGDANYNFNMRFKYEHAMRIGKAGYIKFMATTINVPASGDGSEYNGQPAVMPVEGKITSKQSGWEPFKMVGPTPWDGSKIGESGYVSKTLWLCLMQVCSKAGAL